MAPTPPNPQDDLAPHWNWGRALPAPGRMGVDFETRVDFRRLQRYRLARARDDPAQLRVRLATAVRRQ